MSCLDKPTTHRQRRTSNFRPEIHERRCGTDDVHNRIDRTHFMKMHFFERHAVHRGFCLSKPTKNTSRQGSYVSVERRSFEHRIDRRVGSFGLRRVHVHIERSRHNPAAMLVPAFEKNPFDRERRNRALNHQQRHAQIQQCRDRHVPRDAAERVEKKDFPCACTLFEQRQTHRMRVFVRMRVRMRVRVPLVRMRMRVRMRRTGIVCVRVFMIVVMIVIVMMMLVVVIVIVIVSGVHGEWLDF